MVNPAMRKFDKRRILLAIVTRPKAVTLGVGLAIAAAVGIGLSSGMESHAAYAGADFWGS